MLQGIRVRWNTFLINRVYSGTKHFEAKRRCMRRLGHTVGNSTKIVGPVFCTGKLVIGDECWIGKNLKVNGNGTVIIGDCCDIGPEVIFQTGGHQIGTEERRAGEGQTFTQSVGDGCWIGGRSTILNDTSVSSGSVIAACACVTKDIPPNVLAGGVPAKIIKNLL